MKTTKQIKTKLDELFKNSNDENLIKGLGEINILVDNLDKEYQELSDKHIDLIKDYTKMTTFIGTSGTPTDNVEETPLSLEEIAERVLNK